MLTADLPILRGRYTLKRKVATAPDHEVWRAVDQNENDLLVKAWPYSGDQPDDVLRALWDAELRNLFRLASSPDAEARLVMLRDARIDTMIKHLVLVTHAPGYATLEQLLQNREEHGWLRELNDTDVRGQLWRGLRRIALGLAQLHDQQMLHRAVNAAAVFVNPNIGPETMRLGGFEFTVHVSGPRFGGQEPTLIPPELSGHNDQRSGAQWYGSCPLHEPLSEHHRRRSFSVNVAIGRYFCHRCHSHGNQLELWAAATKLPLHQAAVDLCRRLGRDVPWIDRW